MGGACWLLVHQKLQRMAIWSPGSLDMTHRDLASCGPLEGCPVASKQVREQAH